MVVALIAASAAPGRPRYDVIDMHFHADLPDAEGPPGGNICAPYPTWLTRDPGQPIERYLDRFSVHPTCSHALVAPTDPAVLRDRSIATLARYNALALAGGVATTVENYRAHASGRIRPSAGFGSNGDLPPIATLRQLHAAGKLAALSEITTQYAGIARQMRHDPAARRSEAMPLKGGISMFRHLLAAGALAACALPPP